MTIEGDPYDDCLRDNFGNLGESVRWELFQNMFECRLVIWGQA